MNIRSGVYITNCQFCGKSHGLRCPDVKSIEYGANGELRKVEFFREADRYSEYPPIHVGTVTSQVAK